MGEEEDVSEEGAPASQLSEQRESATNAAGPKVVDKRGDQPSMAEIETRVGPPARAPSIAETSALRESFLGGAPILSSGAISDRRKIRHWLRRMDRAATEKGPEEGGSSSLIVVVE